MTISSHPRRMTVRDEVRGRVDTPLACGCLWVWSRIAT